MSQEQSSPKVSCEGCRYYQPMWDMKGQCRFHAPRWFRRFPHVYQYEWCGQWEPIGEQGDCSTCCWWDEASSSCPRHGECRRYPPGEVRRLTDLRFYCGEYKHISKIFSRTEPSEELIGDRDERDRTDQI